MIRGKKVDLVAVSMEYLPEYQRWINDPAVSDMLGTPSFPLSREKERRWVESHIQLSEGERQFTVLTKRGTPIGNIGLMSIDSVSRSALLGIMIGEQSYWDRGYGADAIRTLLHFAFETLDLRKVSLHVLELNKRAIACYRSCGFIEEARLRRQIFHLGRYYDDIIMCVFRDDWDGEKRSGGKRGRKA